MIMDETIMLIDGFMAQVAATCGREFSCARVFYALQ